MEVEDRDGNNTRVIDLDALCESTAAALIDLSDKKAILRSFVGYCDGASTRIFEGALEGRIGRTGRVYLASNRYYLMACAVMATKAEAKGLSLVHSLRKR